jgi:hypothetical protein
LLFFKKETRKREIKKPQKKPILRKPTKKLKQNRNKK